MVVVESLVKIKPYKTIEYKYFYRMMKGMIKISERGEHISLQSYGIEVERQDFKGGVLINIERDSICNISPDRHKVHNLLKLLHDNTVSPIHLVDILGEYADEYVNDYSNYNDYSNNTLKKAVEVY